MEDLAGETLNRLAALVGVEPFYYDIWGKQHLTSPETTRAILAAMGVEASEAELKRRLNARWLRLIEPVTAASVNDQPRTIPLHFPLEEGREKDVRLSLSVRDERGAAENPVEIEGITASESTVMDGVSYVRAELPNRTDRDIGYYEISVAVRTPSSKFSGRMRLIIAPDRCHEPTGRAWGIYANLYALRSGRNWGVGDLGDLLDMVWGTSGLGGDFVGINPLHATPNSMSSGISPYSSTSRLYMNYIYLDMDRVSDASGYRELIDSPGFRGEIEALREAELIDYEGAAALKTSALRAAFEDFHERHLKRGTSLAADFKHYAKAEGRLLEDFAAFSAIEERLRAENPGLRRREDWPPEYRTPEGPSVAEFVKTHEKEALFHQYVQWLMDRQLRDVSDEAEAAGVTLYGDMAVGSSGAGSDAWSCPEVFAFGMEAGAPPDAFNLNGQTWGFPPLIPEKLRETGYELFIQTIRKNLKYLKALRIDHALGLFRLFWVAEGASPAEGAYVRYPNEDLLRIIALESVRQEAVIIAEDLGTVGEDVREALHRFGMLSYRLFYFERDWSTARPHRPEEYPEAALAAVTTHDLPTLRGYWPGHDIEIKKALGLYPDEAALQRDISERERDRKLFLDALGWRLPEGAPIQKEMTPELSLSVHRHLARTPCRMVVVSLDDIIGALDQQNMPGTIDSHPNWRRKYSASLDEVLRNGQTLALARMFREEGR